MLEKSVLSLQPSSTTRSPLAPNNALSPTMLPSSAVIEKRFTEPAGKVYQTITYRLSKNDDLENAYVESSYTNN